MLSHIPFAFIVPGQREEGASAGLVAVFIAFGAANLVQHAALVEKDAPAADDPEHGQAELAPVTQIALFLYKLPRFGPQMWQELLHVGVNAFGLVRIDRRPAVLAADAVAPAAKDALIRRFRQIDYRQAAPHRDGLRKSGQVIG